MGTPLKDWDINIYRGILTGYNEAFIISGEKKDELIARDSKSAEIIRPILRGRDIKRYGYDFADLWLICTHNGIKSKGIPPVDVNQYPAIKEHLDMYYEKLAKRQDKGDTPYNLRNCVYMDEFNRQKIMYNDITQKLSFTLVPNGITCANTVYFITYNEHIKYLLAILNSPLIDWYYRTLSVQLGEKAVRMFSIYVLNIPIPMVDKTMEAKINQYFDEIDKNLKSEESINRFVYNLYSLTSKETEYINSFYYNNI